jgi:hypothetical protein
MKGWALVRIAAGGGIAHVPDGAAAGELLQVINVEHVGHQAHALVGNNRVVPGDSYAGALLTPMLQRIEAEIGQRRRFRLSADPENAAGLAGLVGDFV